MGTLEPQNNGPLDRVVNPISWKQARRFFVEIQSLFFSTISLFTLRTLTKTLSSFDNILLIDKMTSCVT